MRSNPSGLLRFFRFFPREKLVQALAINDNMIVISKRQAKLI